MLAGRDVHLARESVPQRGEDRLLGNPPSEDEGVDKLIVEEDVHTERYASPHAAPVFHRHLNEHFLADDQRRIVLRIPFVEERDGAVRVEDPSRLKICETERLRQYRGGIDSGGQLLRNGPDAPSEHLLEHVVGLVGLLDEIRRIDHHLESVLSGSDRHKRLNARPRDPSRETARNRPVALPPGHEDVVVVEVHPHGMVNAGEAAILDGGDHVRRQIDRQRPVLNVFGIRTGHDDIGHASQLRDGKVGQASNRSLRRGNGVAFLPDDLQLVRVVGLVCLRYQVRGVQHYLQYVNTRGQDDIGAKVVPVDQGGKLSRRQGYAGPAVYDNVIEVQIDEVPFLKWHIAGVSESPAHKGISTHPLRRARAHARGIGDHHRAAPPFRRVRHEVDAATCRLNGLLRRYRCQRRCRRRDRRRRWRRSIGGSRGRRLRRRWGMRRSRGWRARGRRGKRWSRGERRSRRGRRHRGMSRRRGRRLGRRWWWGGSSRCSRRLWSSCWRRSRLLGFSLLRGRHGHGRWL